MNIRQINNSSAFKSVKYKMMTEDNPASKIFEAAVISVIPNKMIIDKVHFQPHGTSNVMKIVDKEYYVDRNVFVVGFGKAVIGMARAIEDILQHHIQTGIISIPLGTVNALQNAGKSDMLLKSDSRIQIFEGAKNNLPDNDSHTTAKKIEYLVKSLKSTDILLVLISGGGSALLPSPSFPITLQDEVEVVKLLSNNAATIHQINMVRKNMETLKGGGLALIAHPAKVVSLILSDVIGDPLDIIASGPTVQDSSTSRDCLDLYRNLEITNLVPKAVLEQLDSRIQRSDGQEQHDWSSVQNVIVGSNKIAVSAASDEAKDLGYIPYILSTTLDGEAKEVGSLFVHLAKYICMVFNSMSNGEWNPALVDLELKIIKMGLTKAQVNDVINDVNMCRNSGKGLCVISGGETTVHIKGTGIGGRNQEMVLSSALVFEEIITEECVNNFDINFLSAGTDGLDGPTDVAGVVISPNFAEICHKYSIDLKSYLDNNDSYTLFSKFQKEKVLIKTGITGTNVMDIQIVLVKPRHF